MLRRRVCDEKVNVRKAAIQALESLILLDVANFCNQVGSFPLTWSVSLKLETNTFISGKNPYTIGTYISTSKLPIQDQICYKMNRYKLKRL